MLALMGLHTLKICRTKSGKFLNVLTPDTHVAAVGNAGDANFVPARTVKTSPIIFTGASLEL